MAGLSFDDLIPAPKASGGGALSFDDLIPAGAPKAAEQPGVLSDIGNTILPGLARGIAGTAALPNTVMGFLDREALTPMAGYVAQAFGKTPTSKMPGGDTRKTIADGFLSQDQLLKPVEAVTGPLYHPKTLPGEIANTVAEFVPNALFGGGTAAQRLGQVVVPALASEGAGQTARRVAPEAEPYARFGGAVLGGVGAAVAQAPRNGSALMREGLQGVTAEELQAAQALREQSRALPGGGFELPLDEAVNRVTDGRAARLSQISRVVANSGGPGAEQMASLYAARPGQIAETGRNVFDTLGPLPNAPSAIGLDVQTAARAGVHQTPQGMALAQAREAAGPRVTPEQAGQVIQPELRRVYDRREGMRAALGEQEYAAARSAPETVGIERAVPVERPGEPIVTYPQHSRPQFTDAAPRPLDPPSARGAAAADGPTGPESLARFIARNGGLDLTSDLRSQDFHRFNIPGLGTVAREGGKPLDSFWRVKLMENGYLRPDADGGMARDIRGELMRKLENEKRGVPSYPIGAERAAAAERARPSQVAEDYAASLSLAESRFGEDLSRVGVDPASVHPDIRDRVLGALMRGEHSDPLQAYEHTVSTMKGPLQPYSRSTTVTEQIPDVRFGQANPQSVVDHIDEALGNAKGPVAKALSAARETLFTRGGEGRPRDLDLSVAGLHGAREAINDLISKAEPTAQRALMGVRERLDRSLSAVPEYEYARSGFEAASRNLDPFDTSAAPGRIVAQDQASGRFAMPPERAPVAIDDGPTAARTFNQVASPDARTAYEGHLTTRLLDGVTDARGNISAEGLLKALRDQSDVLNQAPAVRDRLSAVAQARDGLAPVEVSPLGQLAATSDTRAATEAMFPRRPLAGSQGEIGAAMGAVVRNDLTAGLRLFRQHLEGNFNTATQDVRGTAKQYGGAGFASRVRGTKQLRDNLDAVTNALPNGAGQGPLLDRFLTALEATGYRPQKGSDTAFNTEIRKLLESGKAPLPQAITDAVTSAGVGAAAAGAGGAGAGALLALRRGAGEGFLRHRVNRSGADLVRLLLDRSVPTNDLLSLLSPNGRPDAHRFMLRLLGSGSAGGTSDNIPNRARRPVRQGG